MSAVSSNSLNGERRRRVMLGNLPDNFLRVGAPAVDQEDADQQAAIALHRELNTPVNQNDMGRLNITVDQAKLVKNYGFTRMDPYVRLRIGHCVYETHSDTNGGKNPRWNKVVQCLIPPGVKFINVEIYDERSFTMDELIAWAQIPIPPAVFKGEVHEEWFPLSGKQGDGLEGTINLVLSYLNGPGYQYPVTGAPPVMMVPRTGSSFLGYGTTYTPVPVYRQPVPPQVSAAPYQISPADIKLIEEMFPNIEKDVIKSVLEENGGNKEAAINTLIQISQ